ncbi:hypothetical protein K435DRAFT_926267 [Dendrothele bispora CBS 962.96]|uniref:NAD(P)-binding protein n=1 Tax=Dendrothele bispora (strain CBS 962.96) TaxID=1314807 RepID=A0A4S8L8T7_DENBC|nr:hypothetical protein K435DRAFT_926267 [Dendrothele bispora CBS 962.96]
MPPLPSIRVSNSAILKSTSYIPTAVLVGGTSGIAQGRAEAFAHHTKGNARIFILGRNKQAAETNVQKATQELRKKHGVLVMSQGYFSVAGYTEAEGLDKKMAVHYYSRYEFIEELLPSLSRAKEGGEDAKVLATPTYNDLMLEGFAARNPTLTFGHAYPGFVRTNLGNAKDSPLWMKASVKLVVALTYPLSVSVRDCGEYLLHGVLETMKTPGAWRITNDGSDLGKKKYYGPDEDRKALWEHTVEVTKVK